MLERLVAAGEGGVLVGAHFGSFDALRALAARSGVPLTIVMSTRNAARLASVLGRLDSALVRVFDMEFAGPVRSSRCARASPVVNSSRSWAIASASGAGTSRPRVVPGRGRSLSARSFCPGGALQCAIILVVGIRVGLPIRGVREPLRRATDTSPGGRQAWIVRTVTEVRTMPRTALPLRAVSVVQFLRFLGRGPQSSRVVA